MKSLMALGGMIGFALGILLGLAQHNDGSTILWHSAVAAYATGMLMRWWGNAWVRGLEQAHRERLIAAQAKLKAKTNPAPAK